MKRENRGGTREGAGRPLKHGEETIPTFVRLPVTMREAYNETALTTGKSVSQLIIEDLKNVNSNNK